MWVILVLFLARSAKERKVRIWKDYVAPTANLDQKDRQFVAKVRTISGFIGFVSLVKVSSLLNLVLIWFSNFHMDHLKSLVYL